MRAFLVSSFLLQIIAATDIQIEMAYDSFAPFRVLSNVHTDSGVVQFNTSLALQRGGAAFISRFPRGADYELYTCLFNSISLSIDLPNFPFSSQFRTGLPRNRTIGERAVVLDVSPRSNFSQTVDSFILTPTSDTRGLLIVNPSNPSQYAYDGHWDYTTSLSDLAFEVEGSISIIPADQTIDTQLAWESEPATYRLSSDPDPMWVPHDVMTVLLQEIDRVIGDVSFEIYPLFGGYRTGSFQIDDESIFDRLPSIRYTITIDSERAVILPMFPRDYLARTFPGSTVYRLQVCARPNRNIFTIGQPLLSRMAIHLNGHTNTIGIGEPLVDLR